MAVILPRQDPWEGLGTGLGSGLGGALQQLSNMKLQEMMQQRQRSQTSKGLAALPGITQERANALASLDPQVLREVIKRELSAPSEQMFAQSLSSLLGGEPMSPSGSSLQQLGQGSGAQGQGMNIPAGLKPQQALQLAQLGVQQKNLASKEARAEQFAVDKETAPYYKDVLKQGSAARNNEKRLNRMDELIKTGKLTNPTFASGLKTLSKGIFGFGIDLQSLMNPESQEFEKLSNDFVREAKEIFGGGRLTDADLSQFMRIVPTLSLSNEGKARIMDNMRQLNKASELKEKALKQIIKENGGKRPRNLEILVEERVQPEIDKLAESFKRNYENVAPTQSLIQSLGGALPGQNEYNDLLGKYLGL